MKGLGNFALALLILFLVPVFIWVRFGIGMYKISRKKREVTETVPDLVRTTKALAH